MGGVAVVLVSICSGCCIDNVMNVFSDRKRLAVIFLSVFYIFGIIGTSRGEKLGVSTYNIYRLSDSDPDERQWNVRRDEIVRKIRALSPNVFGVQEAKVSQVRYLSQNLLEYDWVGKGRNDGGTAGEYAAIFYYKSTYTFIETGTFWFSDTPDTPSIGGSSWGNPSNKRICTWVRLKSNKTNQSFYLYNLHLENGTHGQLARIKSTKLLGQKIDSRGNSDPFIIVGDFNAVSSSEEIKYLTENKKYIDSYASVNSNPDILGYTYMNWNNSASSKKRIDYIFASPDWTIIDSSVERKITTSSARSNSSPSLQNINNHIYLIWSGRGDQHRMFISSTVDGNSWSARCAVNQTDTTDHTPALAYFNGRFYLAWTGRDSDHHLNIMSSSDGVTWGNKKTFSSGSTEANSNDSPSLLVANGRLYMSWSGRGTKHRMFWMSTANGSNWTARTAISQTETTDHTPPLAYFNGRFYIAWTGRDSNHHLNVMSSSNGSSWGGKKTFRDEPNRARSDVAPRLLAASGHLYLTWTGRGDQHRMFWMSTTNESSWTAREAVSQSETTSQTPAIVSMEGIMPIMIDEFTSAIPQEAPFYIAWSGLDAARHLNIMGSNDLVLWGNKSTFK